MRRESKTFRSFYISLNYETKLLFEQIFYIQDDEKEDCWKMLSFGFLVQLNEAIWSSFIESLLRKVLPKQKYWCNYILKKM